MEVMGLGSISVGSMFQSSLLPLRSKVFSLSISRNVAPTSVAPPPPTPSLFLWNEFFAPGRPQRLSRQRSLTASRVSADGSTTFRGRDSVEPLVCSVQDMKSLRWCLRFDRTAKLFFVYFLVAGTLIVYHWPVRPKKVKLHYKYCIKRGKA
jgi:hypothetical protein